MQDLLNPSKTSDWPHFLCGNDPAVLPKDVLDFVQNK